MGKRHTLVHQLADWAERKPNEPAIHGKVDGQWQAMTWKEYWGAVREVAKGLIAFGHQEGECIAIVGNNRMEWVICQFGIMAARGVPAPIYTTNTIEQVAYIVEHSKSKIAVCDSAEQLDKYRKAQDQGLMTVDTIITMDTLSGAGEGVMSLDKLRELGRQQDDQHLDARLDALTVDETCLLIYTSGTTGVPKAVTLEHAGMAAVIEGAVARFPLIGQADQYKAVSYLPLCHVAEQLFTNLAHLYSGGKVYFCPDLKQMKDHLLDAHPTVFLGVPRVWEKFQAAMEAKLAQATGVKAKLAAWARKTEFECFKKEIATGKPHWPLSRKLANKLVISKIAAAIGLDELKVAITGAAPISVETLEFFASIGITIYEGYEMSETTGVATCPEYGKPRFGTVGMPLPGVEAKVAEDGELLLKGRNMTRSYLHMPEQTAELIDEEGWLHTGDLAAIDKEGNVRITGRKKDLIITAGGKNVAPIEIEAKLKSILGVGQAVVVGDRQPYLCALISLDPESVEEFAKKVGVSHTTLSALAADEKVQKFVEEHIETNCNAGLARYQTVKKFKILPNEFSVEGGELTPTMKIKRNVVTDKYKDEISAFYA